MWHAPCIKQGREALNDMKKLTLLLATGLMTLAPLGASAAVRVFVGPPVVGYGYGYGFYRPYWGPGYYAPYDNSGEVKIDSKGKSSEVLKETDVFVNGSYAGTVKDNKTMHFRPGSYNIEIRHGGQKLFAEKVYVAAGKTLHINPEL